MLNEEALNEIFTAARTFTAWQDKAIGDDLLKELYELCKWAPTSMNASPARFIFVRSPEGKAKLKESLSAGNVDKTMAAPVTVIVATDRQFYEHLPKLAPHMKNNPFVDDSTLAESTELRNGILQGAYFIIAARALGLDCGPMSGFNQTKLDAAFFPDGRYRSNFLINLGYGDRDKLRPRAPRLSFEEACTLE